jgi:hypothetical protein
MRILTATIAIAPVLSGCGYRLMDFTVISSKNVTMPSSKAVGRVKAEDCVPVVFIPFGMPNVKTAVDRAIEQAGGDFDALVDGVVSYDNRSFIFGKVCYEVEGTPISTRGRAASLENARGLIVGSRSAN